MKRCNACEEEFEDKFSFCPSDGTPLNELTTALVGLPAKRHAIASTPDNHSLTDFYLTTKPREFRLTMISSAGLLQRLVTELRFVAKEIKKTWPQFKRDPIAFAKREAVELAHRCKRTLLTRDVLASTTTAVLVVLTAVLSLFLLGRAKPTHDYLARGDIADEIQFVSFAVPNQNDPAGTGVGANSNGRVGFNQGKGEGSERESKPAHGGGGGGLNDPSDAQNGRLPQVSQIPAPIPKTPPINKASLPEAGIDIDPALWKELPMSVYGDPRSKSTLASNGPGNGGGMGNGNGLGVGEGIGNGVGPGEKGNMGGGEKGLGGNKRGGSDGDNPGGQKSVFNNSQVEQRARVLSKPEPQYTEEARKGDITGTVVLRVIFSETGEVTNIHTIRPLPMGLTEKAISAARQIRFVPAMRGGHPVSVYMQLEYNFSLY